MRKTIGDLIEKLTANRPAYRAPEVLYEEIPASSGWHRYSARSAVSDPDAVLTGIMLAFNYAPTPGDLIAVFAIL